MLDFSRRRIASLRRSARLLIAIAVARMVTITCTGIAIGYVLMFPVVCAIVDTNAMHRRGDGIVERGTDLRTLVNTFRRERDTADHDDAGVHPGTVLLWTSLIGVATVGIGVYWATWHEARQLRRRGGWAIGLAVGGRHIETPSTPDERKLINVVEEMAIAFDHRPPTILILDDEAGINCFAAGLVPTQQILCVTGGAIAKLSRDELQGMIAHEFVHLTHHDTERGTRLTASLHGLRGIQTMAETLVRAGIASINNTRRDRYGNRRGGGGFCLVVLGAAMYPFGAIGAAAAMSLSLGFNRHREEFADAEAVAKTRNPVALARVLRIIAGHPNGGRIKHVRAAIVAPMCFVDRTGRRRGVMSSHPPMFRRIAAIDPKGDGTPILPAATLDADTVNDPASREALGLVLPAFAAGGDVTFAAAAMIGGMGDPRNVSAALVVLSALAGTDRDDAMSDYVFMRGWSEFHKEDAKRIPLDELDGELLRQSFESLRDFSPDQKRRLVAAVAMIAGGDGNVSENERAFLDVIGDVTV